MNRCKSVSMAPLSIPDNNGAPANAGAPFHSDLDHAPAESKVALFSSDSMSFHLTVEFFIPE